MLIRETVSRSDVEMRTEVRRECVVYEVRRGEVVLWSRVVHFSAKVRAGGRAVTRMAREQEKVARAL